MNYGEVPRLVGLVEGKVWAEVTEEDHVGPLLQFVTTELNDDLVFGV